MDDLIIKLRSEALKNNLSKIQGVLEAVDHRRAEIEQLSTHLFEAQQNVNECKYSVLYVLDTSQNQLSKARIDPSFIPFMDKALNLAKSAVTNLKNVAKGIMEIRTRFAPIEDRLKDTVRDDLDDK